MTLPENLVAALHNLVHKRNGDDVAWINIADARALTDLGLAERTRSGWVISPAGQEAIKDLPEPVAVIRLAP